jgi:phosphomannomutase
MTQPTLQEVFGANATQTATEIVIKKSDLPFTALVENNGEQVAAALAKKLQSTMTRAAFDTDADRSIYAEKTALNSLSYRTIGTNTESLIISTLALNFAQVQPVVDITPDLY